MRATVTQLLILCAFAHIARAQNASLSAEAAYVEPTLVASAISFCLSNCNFKRATHHSMDFKPKRYEYKYNFNNEPINFENAVRSTRPMTIRTFKDAKYGLAVDYISARSATCGVSGAYIKEITPRIYGKPYQNYLRHDTSVEFRGSKTSDPYNKGTLRDPRWYVSVDATFDLHMDGWTSDASKTDTISMEVEVNVCQPLPAWPYFKFDLDCVQPINRPCTEPPTVRPRKCPLSTTTEYFSCMANDGCSFNKKSKKCVLRYTSGSKASYEEQISKGYCERPNRLGCYRASNMCIWQKQAEKCVGRKW